MELLDQLVKILGQAPHLAIWVFVIIYGYKVIIVGSIYQLIRYCFTCIKDMHSKSKEALLQNTKLETEKYLRGHFIDEATFEDFMSLLGHLHYIDDGHMRKYIHSGAIRKLRQLADEYRMAQKLPKEKSL